MRRLEADCDVIASSAVSIFKRAWAAMLRWMRLGPPSQTAPTPSQPVVPDDLPPAPPVGLANVRNIHDVLDNLDTYFEDLRALKKMDESAYHVFSRLGGQLLVDEDTTLRARVIDPEFISNPPTIRCAFFSGNHGDDKVAPTRIIYLMLMAGGQICVTNESYVVLPKTGLNFSLTLVHKFKSTPIGVRCFVNMDSNGIVTLLKERRTETKHVKNRKRDRYTTTASCIPAWIKEAAQYHGKKPSDWIQGVVAIAASAKRPKDCILVRASHENMTAAWTIDRNDAKRFFAQRETGTAPDGRRKRVLHYVGAFTRTAEGRKQEVRAHYRGEREFEWNGYSIAISGLGFHHDDYFDARIEGIEDESITNSKLISMKKTSKWMRAYYDRPVFLTKRPKSLASLEQ